MFWQIYTYIAVIAIAAQLLFVVQAYKNSTYSMKKAAKDRDAYNPPTLLTVPCKGIDNAFERNITSIFNLRHENFYLNFVVQDTGDPAYPVLCELKDKLAGDSKARNVQILVSGLADGCSQKIHNLLFSCNCAPSDVEIFAFADSDACLKPGWLNHLVWPLRKEKYGASTGYRWFVPAENNLPTLAMSAINAKIAQLLGNTKFNLAWGGSMAIRRKTFEQIGLQEIWSRAVSDDLSLSYAVRKNRMIIAFVPACLVPSYEKTTWPLLFEFARRQFLITRVNTPGTWWFGLLSNLYALLGLWGGTAVALYAAMNQKPFLPLWIAVPVIFLLGQFSRSIIRQKLAFKLFPEDVDSLRPAAIADIFGGLIWSWVLLVCILSSAFGRTITWRNIKYVLVSPTKTIIKSQNNNN